MMKINSIMNHLERTRNIVFSQKKQTEFFQTHSGIKKKKYSQFSDFGSSNIFVVFSLHDLSSVGIHMHCPWTR
jgi:hypothetical protein